MSLIAILLFFFAHSHHDHVHYSILMRAMEFCQTIFFCRLSFTDAFTFSNIYLEEEAASACNIISIPCGNRLGICLFDTFVT